MTKKKKTIKYYNNGWIYNGWTDRGLRTYFGKLILRYNHSIFYYGLWKKDVLLIGQYQNVEIGSRILLLNCERFIQIYSDMCSICMDNKDSIDSVSLDCSHIFCLACIKEWFYKNNTCPLCRREVSKKLISIVKASENIFFF